MRGDWFLADLQRYPWAIMSSWMPTVSRVMTRVLNAQPISAEDRQATDEGRQNWEARAKQSAGYANGSIAVIPIYGAITQRGGMADMSTPTTSASALASIVRQAASDPSISAIVLDVDSPGGSVYGIEELGNAIFDARSSKPVAAVANSLAASAAYWAASQAGELYAAPGAEVGSIGVYAMHMDQSEALKQEGISVEFISAGKYKTEGNSYGPMSDEARAFAQSSVDQYYESFVRAVARGRNTSLKSVREGMGQGRVLMSDQAKAENMIDGVATLGQVVAKLQARVKRAGASSLARAKNELAILG